MPQPPQQIPQQIPSCEDDPNVVETFVDGPIGFNFVNGNMHVTFYTIRLDHKAQVAPGAPLPQVRRVTQRLVIPLGGAVDLHQMIGNMLKMLHSQGIVHPVVPGPQTRQ